MTFVSRLMVNVPMQIPAAYALSRMDKRLAYSLMLYMLAVVLYFSLNAVPR
jgi:ABC-type glycerol-3-phosphate transport system permease component